MDDDVIDDIAAAFFEQMELINKGTPPKSDHWYDQLLDDIVAIGVVIHTHQPTYDMRYFYKNAGYPQPYPIHEMI